jgi:hypothetical protein
MFCDPQIVIARKVSQMIYPDAQKSPEISHLHHIHLPQADLNSR